jgi:hypothetical protein
MVTAAQVDAAVRVLWDGEKFLRRNVDWEQLSDDEREPYLVMTRKMLEAAELAVTP